MNIFKHKSVKTNWIEAAVCNRKAGTTDAKSGIVDTGLIRPGHTQAEMRKDTQVCVPALFLFSGAAGAAARNRKELIQQRHADGRTLTPGGYNYKIIMKEIRFEWDPDKDKQNRIKHGISFKEAASAFLDENAMLYRDEEHSGEEERFILLGLSMQKAVCVVVVHCYRCEGDVIRLISARKATRLEECEYIWNKKGQNDERRI